MTPEEVIKKYPIGEGIDSFFASFKLACEEQKISSSPDALDKLNGEGMVL